MTKKKNRKNEQKTLAKLARETAKLRGPVESYEDKLTRWAEEMTPSPASTRPGPYDGRSELQRQYKVLSSALKALGLEPLGLQFDGPFMAHFCVRDMAGRLSEVHFSTPDVRDAEFQAHIAEGRRSRFGAVTTGRSTLSPGYTFGATPRPVGQRFTSTLAGNPADSVILDEYDTMTAEEWKSMRDWPAEEVEALLKDLER